MVLSTLFCNLEALMQTRHPLWAQIGNPQLPLHTHQTQTKILHPPLHLVMPNQLTTSPHLRTPSQILISMSSLVWVIWVSLKYGKKLLLILHITLDLASPLKTLIIKDGQTLEQKMGSDPNLSPLLEGMKEVEELFTLDYLDQKTMARYTERAKTDNWDKFFGFVPRPIFKIAHLSSEIIHTEPLKEAMKTGKQVQQHPHCTLERIEKGSEHVALDIILAFFMMPYHGMIPIWDMDMKYDAVVKDENGEERTVALPLAHTQRSRIAIGILRWLTYVGRKFLILRMFNGGVNILDSSIRMSVAPAKNKYRLDVRLFTPEPKTSTPVRSMRTSCWLEGDPTQSIMWCRQLASRWLNRSIGEGTGETQVKQDQLASCHLKLSPGWSVQSVNTFGIMPPSDWVAPVTDLARHGPEAMAVSEENVWALRDSYGEKVVAFERLFLSLKPESLIFLNQRQHSWQKHTSGRNPTFDKETFELLLMVCSQTLHLVRDSVEKKGWEKESSSKHPLVLDFGTIIPIVLKATHPAVLPLAHFPSLKCIILPFIKLSSHDNAAATASLFADEEWGLLEWLCGAGKGQNAPLGAIVRLDNKEERGHLKGDISSAISDAIPFWQGQHKAMLLTEPATSLRGFLCDTIKQIIQVINSQVSVHVDGEEENKELGFEIESIDLWVGERLDEKS